jgi:hypothetical protein
LQFTIWTAVAVTYLAVAPKLISNNTDYCKSNAAETQLQSPREDRMCVTKKPMRRAPIYVADRPSSALMK